MINHHQAWNKIDSQFYMEQLMKPKYSLSTTGFEPAPSNCEQEANATRKKQASVQNFKCRGQHTTCRETIVCQYVCPDKRTSACQLIQVFISIIVGEGILTDIKLWLNRHAEVRSLDRYQM